MSFPVSDLPRRDLRPRMTAVERRRQLLEVALDCFAAGGYHETSVGQIADAAGVTKPVLYQHFPSKRELFLELLDTVGQELTDTLATGAAAEAAPSSRVLAGFRAYFDFVCRRTSAFQLLFGSGARLADEFADSVRRLEAEIAETIARFIDADIDDEHRRLLGYALVGLGEVAARRWVAEGGDDLDPEEGALIATRLADMVWAGLRALPGHRQP